MKSPAISARDLSSRFSNFLWRSDTRHASLPAAIGLHTLRILYVVIRDLRDGQLNLRAMGLVYTTLLTIVPILAISFSVLKGFGVHNQAAPMLYNLLDPLGPRGAEIAQQLLEFVDGMKVGVLGGVGIALLFVTVLSMMQKIERALNYIWHVPQQRGIAERFSHYLSVILVGPVLVVASTGISATALDNTLVDRITGVRAVELVFDAATIILPLLLAIGAFTFIYIFVPNTKVNARSALLGAAVAAILWKASGFVFASFVVTSTRYEAIYSAFATLIFFMIWLYLSWLILMIGSAVAFYHQRPEYLTMQTERRPPSSRVKERLALLIMRELAVAQYTAGEAPTIKRFAVATHAPAEAVANVIGALEAAGLLVCTDSGEPVYLPARPLDTTRVVEVLDAVRAAEEDERLNLDILAAAPDIEALTRRTDEAVRGALEGLTLKDLALGAAPQP